MKETTDERREQVEISYDNCGTAHTECPNGSGECERAAAHDGSHRCGSCRGSF
jgi:hypothetical protein